MPSRPSRASVVARRRRHAAQPVVRRQEEARTWLDGRDAPGGASTAWVDADGNTFGGLGAGRIPGRQTVLSWTGFPHPHGSRGRHPRRSPGGAGRPGVSPHHCRARPGAWGADGRRCLGSTRRAATEAVRSRALWTPRCGAIPETAAVDGDRLVDAMARARSTRAGPRAPGRRPAPWAPMSNCTSSRDPASKKPASRSAWSSRSWACGGTVSSSPVRPMMPAPPRWSAAGTASGRRGIRDQGARPDRLRAAGVGASRTLGGVNVNPGVDQRRAGRAANWCTRSVARRPLCSRNSSRDRGALAAARARAAQVGRRDPPLSATSPRRALSRVQEAVELTSRRPGPALPPHYSAAVTTSEPRLRDRRRHHLHPGGGPEPPRWTR